MDPKTVEKLEGKIEEAIEDGPQEAAATASPPHDAPDGKAAVAVYEAAVKNQPREE